MPFHPDGVVIGTAFLASPESFAHDYHKERIVAARSQDTLLADMFHINWLIGAPVRVLQNSAARGERGDRSQVRHWVRRKVAQSTFSVPTRRYARCGRDPRTAHRMARALKRFPDGSKNSARFPCFSLIMGTFCDFSSSSHSEFARECMMASTEGLLTEDLNAADLCRGSTKPPPSVAARCEIAVPAKEKARATGPSLIKSYAPARPHAVRDAPCVARLTTVAAMPASTALACGDFSMLMIGFDAGACP